MLMKSALIKFNSPLKITLYLVYTIFLVTFLVSWAEQCVDLIRYNIPTEYRDWAVVDLAQSLYKNSPYDLDIGPPFFFLYGFLFSSIIGAINYLFNIDSFLLSKLIIFICVILSSLLTSLEIFNITKKVFPSILGFMCMLWASSNTGVYFIIRPDSLGLFLSLLSLALIRRSQNLLTLFISSSVIILAFYTKQYFIFVAVPITFFLLKKSGLRKTLIFCLIFLSLIIISSALISYFLPAYFYSSVLGQFRAVGGNWTHAYGQFETFLTYYWPLFVVIFLYLINNHYKKKSIFGDAKLYVYTFLTAAVCLIPLGKNEGAFLSYYYQLLLPSLIILGMISIADFKSLILKNFFVILIIFYSLFHGNIEKFNFIYSNEAINNWQLAEKLIKSQEGSVLISTPILAQIGKNSVILDNGHSEYFPGLNKPLPGYINQFFPEREIYSEKFKKFYTEIDSQILNKKYNLIATTQGYHPTISQNTLSKYYRRIQEINLQTGKQNWNIEFWVPAE